MSLLTDLVNHPSIRPALGGTGFINADDAAELPFVHLIGGSAGSIFLAVNPHGVAEWHWLLTPQCRGKAALVLARYAIKVAFTELGVHAIVGQTPRVNRAARLMNRALGACPVGTSLDSQGRECINYMLERKTWATFSKSSAPSQAAR